MSNQVQRLRFFDGEYLRSNDFTDEQSYHVEMRRRLNHRLHLHGIVYGLQVVEDQISTPTDKFYSISSGMALDKTGREIFVPAPYSLSSDAILNRAGLQAGPNELWICYREVETGLPAAGYRDCNATDQQTRWQETFQVVLKPVNGPSPITDCGGVRLGTVTLTKNLGAWRIAPKDTEGRTYVGIRAQRVVAPDEEQDTFDMTAQNVDPTNRIAPAGYLDVQPGALERGNLIVEKNVVIGDDFVLDASVNKNLPKNIPGTGNLKVTNDLFLNGDFYGFVNGDWYKLKDYIQTLMPNIVVGTASATISPEVPADQAGTFLVPSGVRCPIVTNTPPVVMVAISAINWQDPNDLQTVWGASPISVGVSLGGISKTATDPKLYDLTIAWTATPVVNIGSGQNALPITALTVSYIVIFMP